MVSEKRRRNFLLAISLQKLFSGAKLHSKAPLQNNNFCSPFFKEMENFMALIMGRRYCTKYDIQLGNIDK